MPAVFLLYISRRLISSLVIFFLFFMNFLQAQPVVAFNPIINSGLSSPVDVVNAGDNRLFIVQQGGTILIYKPGLGLEGTPFLNITPLLNTSGGERGLLSMAFYPGYPGIPYFFVYYTNLPNGDITIARYSVSGIPDIADPNSGQVLLTIPKLYSNHNGGKLNFGVDGYLYFGTGDGGSGNDPENNAQNGNSLLGKMLRIDVSSFATSSPFYNIPPDNPFLSSGDGVRDEIWALGLRNPWRWSFDRLTHDMWIGDVGQGAREEIDYLPYGSAFGVNLGWRCFEGLIPTPNVVPPCNPPNDVAPVFDYPRTLGSTVTGGYVYRGSTYPALYGYYVFADFGSGNVWVKLQGFSPSLISGLPGSIVGFAEDQNAELYAVSNSGDVYQVTASEPLPVTLLNFTAKELNGYNELKWNTSIEENTDRFIIEYANDARSFQIAGEVLAMNNTRGHSYSFHHNIIERKKLFYRLKMIDFDGKNKYSPIISVGGSKSPEAKIYPTIIKNNIINIITDLAVNSVKVYNMLGKEVYINNINGAQGYFSIRLPQLAKGTYIVSIKGSDFQKTEKIVIQ